MSRIPTDKTILVRWTAIWCAALAVVWTVAGVELAHQSDDAERTALREVSALADSYAAQLTKALEEVDHLSASLVYMKEHQRLPDQMNTLGQYHVASSPFRMAYIDPQGVLRNARDEDLGASVADRGFLQRHRASPDRALVINPRQPGVGGWSRTEVIWFTRRVNKADGSFDGVIAVTVPHAFLQSQHGTALFRDGDFASVWLDQGSLLTNWTPGRQEHVVQHFYAAPRFAQPGGARLEPAASFRDGLPFYVGWRKLEHYPVVALSARSPDNVLAASARDRERLVLVGLSLSALITLGCGAGVMARRRWVRRERHQEEMQRAFRRAVEGGQDVYFMLRPRYDERGQAVAYLVDECSEGAAALMGWPRHAVFGKPFGALLSAPSRETLARFLDQALAAGNHEQELELADDDAGVRQFALRAVRSAAGIAVAVRDISAQRALAMAALVRTDALTSLPNRAWLQERAEQAVARAVPVLGTVGVLFMDIFDFKNVNDALGSAAGDELLTAYGRTLQQVLRQQGQVARIGGDKFAVLLCEAHERDAIDLLVRQIRSAVQLIDCAATRHGFVAEQAIGVALYPDHAADAAGLLNAAELAMYDAKATGKGVTRYYSQRMSEERQARFRLERELRRALTCHEFVLHFQPRMAAGSRRLLSFEALVRWQHPERGLVPPGEFIAAAEESGMIAELGDWVIEQACRQLAAWRAAGLALVPVSVNVSALQLRTASCREQLVAALRENGVAPALLAVELTESTMVGDDQIVRDELHRLRALGIELHIDDFGTGYSSLSQLQELDVDVIKIDQSFVNRLGRDARGDALCRAIVNMSRALGFRVVAEGVETPVQLRLLEAMGCDEIQGYLVSRPVPADQATGMLVQPHWASLERDAAPLA